MISLHKKCTYSKLFWSAFFPHSPAFGLNTEGKCDIGPTKSIWLFKQHFKINVQLIKKCARLVSNILQ